MHGVCGPLSEFAAETNKGNSVEESLGEAGQDEPFGWSRVSGWTSVSQINRELAPSCTGLAVGRALKKGTMTPTSTSVHGESCSASYPFSLSHKVSQLLFPFISLALFELLTPNWGLK